MVLENGPPGGFSIGLAALAEDLGTDPPSQWAGSESDLARAARIEHELALRQARAGHLEEAFRAAEGVARIYRRLAHSRPVRYQPELALALTSWGLWSSRLGEREQAEAVLCEAVALYRDLLGRANALRPLHRVRLRVGLAVALTNLGSARSELDDHPGAEEAATEAVRTLRRLHTGSPVYRWLCRHEPLGFAHCLASALNNLGLIVARRGHRERAHRLAMETTAIYRSLAAEAPVIFEADLAKALQNLGVAASELGRVAEALSATEESVRLHRALSRTEQADYRQHLGRALCSFAHVRAAAAEELSLALVAAKEAVRVHEDLAARRPQAASGDLHVAYRTVSSVRDALASRAGPDSSAS